MPADGARRELTTIIQKGREVLLQLESISFVDFQSIPADDFQDFYIEMVHVIEGLHERCALARAVLEMCFDTKTRT